MKYILLLSHHGLNFPASKSSTGYTTLYKNKIICGHEVKGKERKNGLRECRSDLAFLGAV
jgi:hypothetical protein